MEPENRPYVDSDTEPGDTGTEDWADTPADADGPARVRWPTRPERADPDGIVDGSPADEFVNDPDAIDKRNRDRG